MSLNLKHCSTLLRTAVSHCLGDVKCTIQPLQNFLRNPYSTNTSMPSNKDETRGMMAVWPDVVRDLTEIDLFREAQEASKWLVKNLQYNVPGGKKNRGLSVISSYRLLVSPNELTDDNLRLARILGWCTELFQASYLVLDDIMDKSVSRRGQPCWYQLNNIGLPGVNDGNLLELCVYELLRINFKGKPCYWDLVELFMDMNFKTTVGQSLDLLSTNLNTTRDLKLFTMDRYNSIVKFKTAYYSFSLPVQLAMYFAGIKDPELHRQAETILLEMGRFFQIQDDYIDCFSDPKVSGKIGTDIQDGKCSWTAVVALQRCSAAQRQIMEECYGKDNPKDIEKIRKLYNELGLQKIYSSFEEESYNLLKTQIQQVSKGLPHDLFYLFLDKIYRRKS